MERAAPCKAGCLGSSSVHSDKGRGQANEKREHDRTQGNENPKPRSFLRDRERRGNRCARRMGRRGNGKRGGDKIGLARLLSLAVCCCRPKSRSVPGPLTVHRNGAASAARCGTRRGTLRADVSGDFDKNESGAIGKQKVACVWARVAGSMGSYEAALSSGSPYKCAIC